MRKMKARGCEFKALDASSCRKISRLLFGKIKPRFISFPHNAIVLSECRLGVNNCRYYNKCVQTRYFGWPRGGTNCFLIWSHFRPAA